MTKDNVPAGKLDKIWRKIFLGIPEVLKKGTGHGSVDPDLHQNVMDPQHYLYSCNIVKSDFYLQSPPLYSLIIPVHLGKLLPYVILIVKHVGYVIVLMYRFLLTYLYSNFFLTDSFKIQIKYFYHYQF